MEEVNGYKQRVILIVDGDVLCFKQVQVEYVKVLEVICQCLYLEIMQQVYVNISKVLVDVKGQGNLFYLLFDKLMQLVVGMIVV